MFCESRRIIVYTYGSVSEPRRTRSLVFPTSSAINIIVTLTKIVPTVFFALESLLNLVGEQITNREDVT